MKNEHYSITAGCPIYCVLVGVVMRAQVYLFNHLTKTTILLISRFLNFNIFF